MLWKSVRLDSSLFYSSNVFHAALLCVSCDIPAARKCCGFKSYAARLGCHKCMKIFPGDFGEKKETTQALIDGTGNQEQNSLTVDMLKGLKTQQTRIKQKNLQENMELFTVF